MSAASPPVLPTTTAADVVDSVLRRRSLEVFGFLGESTTTPWPDETRRLYGGLPVFRQNCQRDAGPMLRTRRSRLWPLVRRPPANPCLLFCGCPFFFFIIRSYCRYYLRHYYYNSSFGGKKSRSSFQSCTFIIGHYELFVAKKSLLVFFFLSFFIRLSCDRQQKPIVAPGYRWNWNISRSRDYTAPFLYELCAPIKCPVKSREG